MQVCKKQDWKLINVDTLKDNVAIIDCFVSVSLTQPRGEKRIHDIKCINFPIFNLHGG